jgi:hypothetical protein
MTPYESFRQLTPDRQRQVALLLCEQALQVWTAYVAEHAPIRYSDSVVGMRHEVDVRLPYDALYCAQVGADVYGAEKRYLEPIAAMQDDDLEFPATVRLAYYAIYNCFRKYACGDELDAWLVVNQARGSIDDQEGLSQRLTDAIAATS